MKQDLFSSVDDGVWRECNRNMQNNNKPISPFMDMDMVSTEESPMIKSYFERDNIILIQEYLSICVYTSFMF